MWNEKNIYRKFGLCWNVYKSPFSPPYAPEYVTEARCPKLNCHCEMKQFYWGGIHQSRAYQYECINPDCKFQITLEESIDKKWVLLIKILEWKSFKNAKIIDLDGELIPINERLKIEDSDYWVDARISENKKWEKQLMVLAWSKKSKDKTQLFLDSSNEKFWFDQNDTHPREVFSQVTATFKNSNSNLSINK